MKFLSASEFVKFIKISKESPFICRQFPSYSNHSNKKISVSKFKVSFVEEKAMQLNLKHLSQLTRKHDLLARKFQLPSETKLEI